MISVLTIFSRLFKGLRRAFHLSYLGTIDSLPVDARLGTIFYSTEENLSIVDALYFCITTLSTVGHPTFVPTTTLGKVFTMAYITIGCGLFLTLIATLSYVLIKQSEDE
ncbi:potassium channel family protein [Exiguobacterium sp. SL14]|nr:potassium channel family protein [Exiguobacterium sp. SL14]MCY1689764.1 potassium channel family protein [Exiguobacterium sp. SL14]